MEAVKGALPVGYTSNYLRHNEAAKGCSPAKWTLSIMTASPRSSFVTNKAFVDINIALTNAPYKAEIEADKEVISDESKTWSFAIAHTDVTKFWILFETICEPTP
jgi:hypothetical protein